jgi:hypothetical protein
MSIGNTFTSSSSAPLSLANANPTPLSLANANPTPPSLANANPTPPLLAPALLAPALLAPALLARPSPKPSSQDDYRASTFKQGLSPDGTSGLALRQNNRYNRANAKKQSKLQGLRSYGPGEAIDPPYDPPLSIPVEKEVAPAVPMSAFIRSMAVEAEAMEKEVQMEEHKDREEQEEKSMTSSVSMSDLYDDDDDEWLL